MLRRALVSALLVSGLVAITPPAQAEPVTLMDCIPDGTNPWLEQRVLNMAHSGGEHEAPTNTLYAFKRAAKLGADMLELDVQSTSDEKLVVMHNATVDETTDGTGKVVKQTLKQIKALDAAYWFVPGQGTTPDLDEDVYTLRGARHGKPSVKGYINTDFAIPTLRKVFKTFPDTPINIEIKGTSDANTASYKRNARLLAAFLNDVGRCDVIVTSFNDEALAYFHTLAPQIAMAPGRNALTQYLLSGTLPPEGTVAFQVPVTYSGIAVATKEFVAKAHADGYAVHVWFSGTAPDTAKTYRQMLQTCADGLMPAKPTVLENILDRGGIIRPGKPGVDPCS